MSQEIYTRGKELKESKRLEIKVTKKDEENLDWYIVSSFAEGS